MTLAGHAVPGYSPATHRLKSVFFGGGTPSLMHPHNIARVLAKSADLGTFDAATEVTVECNPTSFDNVRTAQRFFEDLRAAGVNRVSIGIQGLKPEWLNFLGREHQVADALATLDAAQAVFGNVNADVIYGLPNQQLGDWIDLLETLVGRSLTHVSAYQLTIEKNTRFYADVKRGAWKPIDGDLEADFFEATQAVLTRAGYENYEISNFSRPGFACQHNVHVWQYGEYIGIGAGAHGRTVAMNGTRLATQVVKQPDGYLRRMKDLTPTSPEGLVRAVALSRPEAVQEALFSGLRLKTGCHVEDIRKRSGTAFYEAGISGRETLDLISAGFLEEHRGYLRLTAKGWPRLNSVLTRLLRPLPPAAPLAAAAEEPAQTAYKDRVIVTIS